MELTHEERSTLEHIAQNQKEREEHRRNARLLLQYAEGRETRDIAAEIGLSESRTRYLRKLFERHGMDLFAPDFTPQRRAAAKPQTQPTAADLLTDQESDALKALLHDGTGEDMRKRIQIILSYAAGETTNEIAEQVGLSASRTRFWRKAFEREGVQMFGVEAAAEVDQAPGDTPPAAATAPKKKTPGITPDDNFTEAGRKVLWLHFHEMIQQERSSGLGSDPEVVHRMRVATRRMRSTFDVFRDAFSAKAIKKYRKPLKNTGRALGHVRDLDVLLMHMHDYAQALPEEEAAAFQPLMEEWENERRRHFEALLVHLQSDEYRSFCSSFGSFVDTEGKGSVAEPLVIEDVPKRMGQIAPVLIMERYTDILSFGAALDTATLDQLHMLRIQFKKLRYTMEYFVDLLGPQARKVIRQVTDVQDYLGLLQDDQTAGEIVTAFIQELDQRQAALPLGERLNSAPLLTYLAERQSRKHSLLTSFGDTWDYFVSRDFRKRFLRALLSV